VTSVTFYGHYPITYPHYIDLATGKALSVVPGGSYNVAPASGNLLSAGTTMPLDGRFVLGTNVDLEAPSEDEDEKEPIAEQPFSVKE
jgi:hypothetical protein